jgi:hypothetical protein
VPPRHTPPVSRAPAAFVRTLLGRSLFGACVRAAVVMVGCGGGEGDPNASGGTFIAFSPDFADFHAWTPFDLGMDQSDGITVAGTRRAYLNKVPPTGSTSFPTGTIIVKTIGEDLPMPGQTFAMAKRGEPYNARGAVGWEWFELVESAGGAPAIKWRGITPPAGETYAGIMGGACNTCHAMGAANDFVPSAELSLDQF